MIDKIDRLMFKYKEDKELCDTLCQFKEARLRLIDTKFIEIAINDAVWSIVEQMKDDRDISIEYEEAEKVLYDYIKK